MTSRTVVLDFPYFRSLARPQCHGNLRLGRARRGQRALLESVRPGARAARQIRSLPGDEFDVCLRLAVGGKNAGSAAASLSAASKSAPMSRSGCSRSAARIGTSRSSASVKRTPPWKRFGTDTTRAIRCTPTPSASAAADGVRSVYENIDRLIGTARRGLPRRHDRSLQHARHGPEPFRRCQHGAVARAAAPARIPAGPSSKCLTNGPTPPAASRSFRNPNAGKRKSQRQTARRTATRCAIFSLRSSRAPPRNS
jgi:hypothetical protein